MNKAPFPNLTDARRTTTGSALVKKRYSLIIGRIKKRLIGSNRNRALHAVGKAQNNVCHMQMSV
jgi:hypothetical protein